MTNRSRNRFRLALATVAFFVTAVAHAQLVAAPPPEPAIAPEIPDARPFDANGSKIDDTIEQELSTIRAALSSRTVAPTELASFQAQLSAPIRIELVFAQQVTQPQIDAFLALGGTIDHVYRAVSYGWTGRLPRATVEALPAAMGPSLVLVVEDRSLQLHMDEATRTGRVRPVWASGFAGSGTGFSGDSNITIAILDSGVDDSHTDLAGRMEYWKDYTTDAEATPRDIVQHGTIVAGVALGTGAAFGVGPGTLTYTDSNDLTGFPVNTFFASKIHLPAVSLTYTQNATWLGGGSTNLLALTAPNGTTSYSALSAPTTGASGIVEANTFSPVTTSYYTAALQQNAGGTVGRYAVVNTVTNYPAVGDGFSALRGVAPVARWAGAKVFTNADTGSALDFGAALDDMVAQSTLHNIKVINMSLGLNGAPGINTTVRAKSNTAVNNGIVTVVSAGNDGPGIGAGNVIDDPGRAALVITVAASNGLNELTQYSSSGFLSPGSSEDDKPDVMAPGGSTFYSAILSVDSNDADGKMVGFADRVANDYYNTEGTSMAAPFVAGAAALVIEALQDAGLTWSFSSSTHPLLVKNLLCASATESNANREVGTGSDPTLGRAATPKDRFEGYGLINPDAAIEAVTLPYACAPLSDSTTGTRFDRRAWGRKMSLSSGVPISLSLAVPASADYDLYLYSITPDSKGNPVIRASSTNAGLDADEAILFTPSVTETAYLFVKRVSGSGTWMLTCPPIATPTATLTPPATPTSTPTPTPTATVPTCASGPLAGCRTPAVSAKASFQYKDVVGNDPKDRLQWKWSKGSVTTKAEFGTPLTTTNYLLCIYDGASTVIFDSLIPAGGQCGASNPKPCWKDKPKGFDYQDKDLSPDGVSQLKLQEGLTAGKAQIQLKGKGDLLDDPALPFGQPVTVQLQNTESGLCWEAVYSFPATKNVAGPPTGQFKDKAD